ncbi:Protein UPSTREAM OF FLC like [Actinidia chinensis var. chinensis]|uniref:Protein UPSTREAM OF FLC like n=1 Tax=Actinidia chinensis var. chinensis TaxID=1590841 RepID=A0A2R6QKW2_ACTCC|nr:Protein UPSTREAM OF FLC like [Actinidia chinensis var. chinensis]
MEAQEGGGGGSGGGGEERRIYVLYFLSRDGRIEHPHLISIRPISRNGVRLRDVKRWLSKFRGKDMPDAFAWSYKRKYKSGYVWKDLLDEDLITPISDNEYVLKGSEIAAINLDLPSDGEKKASIENESTLEIKEEIKECPETTMDVSTKTPCEIEDESPPCGSEASTFTDDSTKFEEEKHLDTNKKETLKQSNKLENSSPIFSQTLLNKKDHKKTKNTNGIKGDKNPSTPASSTSSSSSFTKSKSNSMFRNLITCGAVDTYDSAMVTINRPIKKPDHDDSSSFTNMGAICKGENLVGSERIFRTSWDQQQNSDSHPNARKSCDGVKSSNNNKSEINSQKPVSAAYKPVNKPNCSQCGKMFKPEKMHSHMKSCSGMKSMAKATSSSSSSFSKIRKSMDFACEESVSGYLMAN